MEHKEIESRFCLQHGFHEDEETFQYVQLATTPFAVSVEELPGMDFAQLNSRFFLVHGYDESEEFDEDLGDRVHELMHI
jgi:hypothetical protein